MESGKTDHSPENVLQRVEFTKGSDEERQFCERKFQEAKTLLATYFPSFVPQEPTILISAPFAQLDEEFVGIPGS